MARNVVFIHSANLMGAEDRLAQYISLIHESQFINFVDKIYIVNIGEDLVLKANLEKVEVINSGQNLEVNEQYTLVYMYKWAKEHQDYNILYLHTKGVGKDKIDAIEDWVSYMCYFLISKFDSCLRALETHVTVGVDLREAPMLHYSGNFWWARASHMTTLPNPENLLEWKNPLNSPRHNQEFWICRDTNPQNHACLHDCGISCYERHIHRYPRNMYA